MSFLKWLNNEMSYLRQSSFWIFIKEQVSILIAPDNHLPEGYNEPHDSQNLTALKLEGALEII